MTNSVGVSRSIDLVAQHQAEQELALEWRSAWWRVLVPATLAVVSLVFSFLTVPVWLYERTGAVGGEFGVALSGFGAVSTLVVAFRTAQVRPLSRLEKILVGGAALWLIGGLAFAVLLKTIGGW